MTTGSPVSAEYLNPIIAELRRWAIETRDWLLREFYASGHPPGTEPRDPAEVYQTLIALMQSGSPEFWHSEEAQAELDRLSQRFGPPPPLRPPGGA